MGFSGGGGRVDCGNITAGITGLRAAGERGMRRLLSRTSITIDEAVAILLGRITGPIEFEPIDDGEEAEANSPAFDLRETLEDELEVLDGEHRLAIHEKQQAHFVAEKLAALQKKEEEIAQANVHLSAINDELNKGRSSKLKVDRALSNDVYTFITLHSFNEWVKRRESVSKRPGVGAPAGASNSALIGAKNREPRTRLRQQEEAILAEISKQGLDPMALPSGPAGKSGVKAAVRDALRKSPLFKGPTTFDKAWERLLKLRLMAYES